MLLLPCLPIRYVRAPSLSRRNPLPPPPLRRRSGSSVLALDVGLDALFGFRLPLLVFGRADDSGASTTRPCGVGVRSCGVGGVIIRKLGTAGPPPVPDPPVRWDLALATLELRLDDRGTGMLPCELPRSDLGGDREKSTGDVPSRLDESSLLFTLSE